jgi:hypothetical protein
VYIYFQVYPSEVVKGVVENPEGLIDDGDP